jgi:hypothetical protein
VCGGCSVVCGRVGVTFWGPHPTVTRPPANAHPRTHPPTPTPAPSLPDAHLGCEHVCVFITAVPFIKHGGARVTGCDRVPVALIRGTPGQAWRYTPERAAFCADAPDSATILSLCPTGSGTSTSSTIRRALGIRARGTKLPTCKTCGL